MTGMNDKQSSRIAIRHAGSIILAASVVAGAVLVAFAASPFSVLHGESGSAVIGTGADQPNLEDRGRDTDRDRRRPPDPATPLGAADGVVPDGVIVTVFDDDVPAVANLDPQLLDALRRAATDAGESGIEFTVNSGWRSPAYQEQLLREAILTYGSAEEAARWVATADTSAHVSGDAIDIGPPEVAAWLSEHGAEYGLCQIYRNEPWHFELRPAATVSGCPPMYDDPTQDPRMQR